MLRDYILSTRNSKPGKMLKKFTVNLIREYDDDEIVRGIPRKRFSICKKNTENVFTKGKRSFMCNLNKAYSLFKQQYPNVQVGFSKCCQSL